MLKSSCLENAETPANRIRFFRIRYYSSVISISISVLPLATLLEQHPDLTDKLAQRIAERQLEGETILDESGAIVSPQGLVAQLRRTLSRLVGG